MAMTFDGGTTGDRRLAILAVTMRRRVKDAMKAMQQQQKQQPQQLRSSPAVEGVQPQADNAGTSTGTSTTLSTLEHARGEKMKEEEKLKDLKTKDMNMMPPPACPRRR